MRRRPASSQNTGADHRGEKLMDLEVKIRTIDEVTKHPNADRLDLARLGGYEVVVGRGEHQAGDEVVYLPEASLLPEWLIKSLGLEGRLAGREKNRVKAVRLRGALSQGLVLKPSDGRVWNEETGRTAPVAKDADYAAHLGVVKYKPPIPVEMSGKVERCPLNLPQYDVNDWKLDPEVLADGEPCLAVEKLHGTLTIAVWGRDTPGDRPFVASKGVAKSMLCFTRGEEKARVLYLQTTDPVAAALCEAGWAAMKEQDRDTDVIAWLGETIGPKVQDLQYGLKECKLYVFELMGWSRKDGRWRAVTDQVMREAAKKAGVPAAPLVGEIRIDPPVTRETIRTVQRYAEGPTALTDNGQIREGIVLRHPSGAVRKAVSEAYLTRRSGTERR